MSEIRFGNYRIVSTLGSGALSTIYKAVQEPLGRIVALKALKAQIEPTSSFGEQLDREAKILRDLAHPNIVLLLDVARTASGRPFLVLENVEGPSLQQLLANKRTLGVEVSLAIAIGMVAGLEHAHERGVVHRDVKPSNVLLTTGGTVKMIDFGIAQRVRTASLSDAFGTEGVTPSGRLAPEVVKDAFGTPAYMSPEQILGDFVDARSDLFSLGVVVYEMLSGSRPFDAPAKTEGAGRSSRPSAQTDRSAAQRIRRDAPAALRDRAPHVPRTVERLVMRLLEKAPNDRHASAADVLERLHRELRVLTRDDPAAVVRGALVAAGFAPRENKPGAAAATSPRRGVPVSHVLVGQTLVLVAFVVGVLAIEGGSAARPLGESGGRSVGARLPDQAGGLRVVASPWAHVRVDGQHMETTPFARPISLPRGKHWVTLTHPDAVPIERAVEVVPNETITLDVTMSLGSGAEDAGRDSR